MHRKDATSLFQDAKVLHFFQPGNIFVIFLYKKRPSLKNDGLVRAYHGFIYSVV